MLPVLVEMSQFEQRMNINSLHQPAISAVETLVNCTEIHGDKTLKNVLCITGTTDVSNVKDYYKIRSAVAG